MFYVTFAATFIGLCFLSFFVSKTKGAEWLERIVKISTVMFIVLSMLDVFLPDLFMCSHELDSLEKMTGTTFHAILRWCNLVCFTVLPIAVFQKNKYFEMIATYFCLPIAIVNVSCFYQYIEYFTAKSNSGLQTVRVLSQGFKDFLITEGFRSVFFGLICLFQLVSLVLLTYKNRKGLSVTKSEFWNLILILLGVTYMSLPIYVPQYLLGHINLMMIRFSAVHIAWIISIIAIIVTLYFVFRNRSYEAKYLLVLSMAWALMMQFSQMFTASSELNIMKLPLQLCNLGSYLALLMLLKKRDTLYHFVLIVNVVGAIVAIAILDIGKNVSHLSRLWVVHYIVEHTKVLVIPILCLVLRIFKPIDMKLTKHFSIGFTAYYVFVLILGTISNGIYRMFEGQHIQNFFYANHLFMFDKDTARGLLGFTDPLFENWVIKFGTFELYPLVQGLIFIVFMALCWAVCLLIYALTKKQRRNYIEENTKNNPHCFTH